MRARRRGKRGGVARRGEEGYAGCGGRKGAIGWLHGRGSVPTVILCVWAAASCAKEERRKERRKKKMKEKKKRKEMWKVFQTWKFSGRNKIIYEVGLKIIFVK
jgi:hypothetical protein